MSAEDKVNKKEITQKSTGEKMVESMPDVCEAPSPAEPVDIPYSNTAMSSDTSPSIKKVKIEGKEEMAKESSFKKSAGDEPGQSDTKCTDEIIKILKDIKVLKVPLWIWGFAVIVLIAIVWLLISSAPQPTEPIEPYNAKIVAKLF